ncbi:hypothetical protein AZE42_02469 [Rhizopogon vesiculosus]|uniref:Uncharacterized protein n=1 Tax=Rhizopogon vesiculosus TaxID=180088 RepID=A0A1J8PL31_9AGAM|nr:hypothetical protein AZE42_02469 [Rhizopogon vesiculosus]
MPLNIPGILAPFQLLRNPRLVIPHLAVKGHPDIRQIDFLALRNAGYRGAVFDKDNCLTIPYKDPLVPELEAESVSHHLSVPVLRHNTLKPGYSCIASIRAYFSSLRVPVPDEELVIVGDRIFTDIIMANRMHSRSASSFSSEAPARDRLGGPLAIWTNGVWQKESMVMRWVEKRLVDAVQKWTMNGENPSVDTTMFVRDLPSPESRKEGNALAKLLDIMKRR